MANLTDAQLLTKYNDSSTGLFKDNTNKEIVPNRPRSLVTDLTDSFFNLNNNAYTGAKGQYPGITAPASLKDIVTTTLSLGVLITFTDSTASNVVRIYELTNETTAESSPTVIRPNDYAGTTNERVWRLRVTADVDSDTGSGAATWGAITGTLSGQTDLQSALDAKQTLVNSATALVDGATIDLTAIKHTLSTAASRTFTISYTGDDISIEVTLTATTANQTFPVGSLCVSDGIATGDNICPMAGVSGDKYMFAIKKIGSVYYVVAKNFGQ